MEVNRSEQKAAAAADGGDDVSILCGQSAVHPTECVYMSLYERKINKWVGLPLNGDDFGKILDFGMRSNNLELRRLIAYGSVRSGSKIYFLGGTYINEEVFSPKVFIYDITTKTWKEGSSMGVGRIFPAVVALGEDYIYAFGSKTEGNKIDQWAERYDINGKKWEFLPNPPLSEMHRVSSVHIHAVHQKGHQILLFMKSNEVYSFNCDTHSFTFFAPLQLAEYPVLCNKVVVLDDVLFWHYYGSIHAYHLLTHQRFLLYEFKDATAIFGEPHFHGYFQESFLVQAGENALCILFWEDYDNIGKLHCYKFRFKKSPQDEGGCGFSLTFDQAKVHKLTPYWAIKDVIV